MIRVFMFTSGSRGMPMCAQQQNGGYPFSANKMDRKARMVATRFPGLIQIRYEVRKPSCHFL